MAELPRVYLKLGTDRILPNAGAGASESSLWLHLRNCTMAQAVELAFDQEATKRIESHYGNLYSAFEGYTEVKTIASRGYAIDLELVGGHVITEDAEYERTLVGDGSSGLSEGNGTEHPE